MACLSAVIIAKQQRWKGHLCLASELLRHWRWLDADFYGTLQACQPQGISIMMVTKTAVVDLLK